MMKLIATVFGLVAAVVALFSPVAEAGLNMNHNETLVPDDLRFNR
jgi:hypothetical protein